MEYVIEKLIGGGFWQFCGMFMLLSMALCIVAYAMQLASLMFNRILRTIKVLFRGWPQEHVDADGDWPSTEKSEEEEEK